jgi:hypothetical protein
MMQMIDAATAAPRTISQLLAAAPKSYFPAKPFATNQYKPNAKISHHAKAQRRQHPRNLRQALNLNQRLAELEISKTMAVF